MATVYLAEDLRHHRRVALKVLRPELAAVLGAERFVREIETTARLRHPHILPLYDSGEITQRGEGGRDAPAILYYVMPLVEGESLRDRLDREKQLPVAEALQIGREVADALAYAHAHDVIHRDIKPDNILLESGHAVVADFGIARAITSAGGTTLTDTGITVGTPTYMSPEQAAGDKALDSRTDQYSLGCVLYEMLAGQPPFTGPTVESVVRQHLTAEARSVTQIRPAVPLGVSEGIARALAKVPADRFDSLTELAKTLSPGDQPARPTARRRHALLPALLGAGAVLFAAGVLLTHLHGRTTALQLGRRIQVTLDPGLELDPALSPDGKFLAYSGPHGELVMRQVENGVPLRVVREGDPAGRWPTWLPDGQRLVYVSARGIELVSALGGAPRLIVTGGAPARGVAASPDGRSIAWSSHDSLFRRGLEGGEPKLITVGREVHSFAWSPDGRWIAYVSGNFQYLKSIDLGNVAFSSIWVVPAEGGRPVAVTDSASMYVSPAWAGPRTLLFVSNRDGGRDVYQVELTGAGSVAAPAIRLTTGLSAYDIAWSRDGRRLGYAALTESSNIWSVPIPASGAVSVSRATPATVGHQTIENFDVSYDGRWLGFASDRTGVYQLYRMRLGDPAAEVHQLTGDSASSYWVAWSHDDREIAFQHFRGERRIALVMSSDGGAPVQVTDGREDLRAPEWSPDGTRLTLLQNWATHPEVELVTRGADGRWSAPRPFPIVVGSDTLPGGLVAWSPDGQFLACGCGPGGLVVVPVGGGPGRRLADPYSTSGWAFPQWSADGRTLYHVTEDSGRVVGVVAVPLAGGDPHLALRFDDPDRPWHRFGFRVRGDRFFFTIGDQQSDIWVAEAGGQ